MKYALYGLLFVLLCNGLMFLTQTAVANVAETYGETDYIVFYEFEGSLLSTVTDANYSLNTDSDALAELMPTSSGRTDASSVAADSGSIFVDPITTAKNWFLQTISVVPGISHALNFFDAIITSIPNMLENMSALGIPREIIFVLRAIWYLLFVFITAMLIIGR
jgi:hypothetical protein